MGFGERRVPVANPLAALRIAVPTTVLHGAGHIEWQAGDWVQGEPAGGALAGFLRLWNETRDGEFARFAKRYGVLGVTADGLPHTSTGKMPPHIGKGAEARFKERVSDWRIYARHARALIVLYNALRKTNRIDPEIVLACAGLWPELEPPAEPWLDPFSNKRMGTLIENLRFEVHPDGVQQRSGDHQRLWLGNFLSSEWLSHAAIAPRVAWEDRDRPHVSLTYGNFYLTRRQQVLNTHELVPLFSVLAIQLAGAMCSDERLRECPLCKQIFRPSHHRESYCSDCKTRSKSLKQGRWRNKKAAACTPISTPNPVDDQATAETG